MAVLPVKNQPYKGRKNRYHAKNNNDEANALTTSCLSKDFLAINKLFKCELLGIDVNYLLGNRLSELLSNFWRCVDLLSVINN